MGKYIEVQKLKELIDEKWKELAEKNVKAGGGKWDAEISTYLSVLRLIDTLQQEQPEIDVEKEVAKWWDTFFQEPDFKFKKHRAHIVTNDEIIELARHLLGLNAKKEE